MRTFTRHVVAAMDNTRVQHCVLCGEIINDYRNVMYHGEPPKGFPKGFVYVSEGRPTILQTEEPRETVFYCNGI